MGLLTSLLCSCATTHDYPADDPRSAKVWTPSEVVVEMAGNDPVEPFNRGAFAVNDVLMHYLVRPVSWIYGSILPKEAIKRMAALLSGPGAGNTPPRPRYRPGAPPRC